MPLNPQDQTTAELRTLAISPLKRVVVDGFCTFKACDVYARGQELAVAQCAFDRFDIHIVQMRARLFPEEPLPRQFLIASEAPLGVNNSAGVVAMVDRHLQKTYKAHHRGLNVCPRGVALNWSQRISFLTGKRARS
jgi:hypothetical protein